MIRLPMLQLQSSSWYFGALQSYSMHTFVYELYELLNDLTLRILAYRKIRKISNSGSDTVYCPVSTL